MSRPFRAERIWDGLVACIVAGGESFTAAQARLVGMARAAGDVRVVAINDAIYPCWFADVAYACDRRWWDHHGPLPGFLGLRIGLGPQRWPEVEHLESGGTQGFDSDPRKVRTGGNSVHQALNLVAHFGVRKVILVGVDMRGRHWFGDHPSACGSAVVPSYAGPIRDFAIQKAALDERGIVVVNASPGSALDIYPAVDLERELRGEKRCRSRPSTSSPTRPTS